MHAELVAISEALSYIETLNDKSIVILTDSKSAIQHLGRCSTTFRGVHVAYVIIRSLIKLMGQGKIIKIQWIPSHIGIYGNEQADLLARQASSEGIDVTVAPHYTEHIPNVKNTCLHKWKEYFDQRSKEKGIWYRTIQTAPMPQPWLDKCSYSRGDLTLLMRLRSGHMPLNKFGNQMRKVPSPKCDVCIEDDEDVYHILTRCARNQALRSQLSIGFTLSDPLVEEVKLILDMVKYALSHRKANNI